MQTEHIDRLFLELSQFTNATTEKELVLKRRFEMAITLLRECKNRLETISETHPTIHLKDTIDRANALLDIHKDEPLTATIWWFGRGSMPETVFSGDAKRMTFSDAITGEEAVKRFEQSYGFAPPAGVWAASETNPIIGVYRHSKAD